MAKVSGEFSESGAELATQVNDILQRRMRSIIRQVAADARTNAPVDTGRLAQAIKEDPIVSLSPFKVVGSVTSNAPYSVFVHEGTRYMRARPFLTNAVARVLRDLQ